MLACTEKQMPVSEASTRCAAVKGREGSAWAHHQNQSCWKVLHLDHISGGCIRKSSVRARDSNGATVQAQSRLGRTVCRRVSWLQ